MTVGDWRSALGTSLQVRGGCCYNVGEVCIMDARRVLGTYLVFEFDRLLRIDSFMQQSYTIMHKPRTV